MNDFKINVITSQLNAVRKQETSSIVWRLFNLLFFLTDFILFYGPLNLRGQGPFEIVDIEELEAVFKFGL